MEHPHTPYFSVQELRQSLEAHHPDGRDTPAPLCFYVPALDQFFQLMPSDHPEQPGVERQCRAGGGYDGLVLNLQADADDDHGWFCGLTPTQYAGLQGLAAQILGWVRPALATEQYDLVAEFAGVAESLLSDLAAQRFRWEPFIARLERLAELHRGPGAGLLLHAQRLRAPQPA